VSSLFIGQLIPVGFSFSVLGSATCDGQLMAISQNQALFSLIGTFYGGDGQTTFGLPNLRGHDMVHQGQGPGLSQYSIGQVGGLESKPLDLNTSAHTHSATFAGTGTMSASGATPKASTQAPAAQSVLGHGIDLNAHGAAPAIYCPSGTATPIKLGGLNVAGTVTVTSTAGVLAPTPIPLVNPFTVINVLIMLEGIFPSRN
jgi:microcystin-dependent protein